MNRYPSEQPFPRARAVSIEASSGPTSPGLASLRTYELPPYQNAKALMVDYMAHYGSIHDGAALGIKGEFGSGKTHLIYFLMETVRAFRSDATSKDEPVQIYAKANSGQFFEIYGNSSERSARKGSRKVT
jgi:hypothetical protein